MKYAKCCICHLKWNVSQNAEIKEKYVCPKCEGKSYLPKVVLKNKKRYGGV